VRTWCQRLTHGSCRLTRMWRGRKTRSVLVMGMFGSEGNAHARLFNHLLKDADQFLWPSSGGSLLNWSPLGLTRAHSPLLNTLPSVAIGITLPLFHLLALLRPCCCNCGCCCSSPWDHAPWGVWPLPRLFAVLTSPHNCWLLCLASSHPQTDDAR
jgi:hypothetical protein